MCQGPKIGDWRGNSIVVVAGDLFQYKTDADKHMDEESRDVRILSNQELLGEHQGLVEHFADLIVASPGRPYKSGEARNDAPEDLESWAKLKASEGSSKSPV